MFFGSLGLQIFASILPNVHVSQFDFARADAGVFFFSVVCIRKNSSQARRAENSGRVSHRLLFQLTLPGLDGLRRN